MKCIILLGLSFSFVLSMEQPLPMVQLQNYTLISNDGQEITLDGDWVREYLPGLAERVELSTKHGMSEGAGKVTIKDLNGQALLNFKSLLTDYITLRRAFDKQAEHMAQKASIEDYLTYLEQSDKRIKEQLNIKIEKLPQIGDHFIPLFKEMIGWQMPVIIEESMAYVAVRLLNPQEAYELFKNLDPLAQLLYLNEVEFSVDSIVKLLEWLVTLENNPIAQFLEGFGLFEKVRTKIIDFVAQNSQKLFPITIIRPGHLWAGSTPFISDLGDQIIALHDNSQIKNIYDFKKDGFKSLKWISSPKREEGYVFWNPDKLIIYEETSFDVYDINTSKKIFAPSMTKHLKISPIRQIVPISNDQLLIIDKSRTIHKLTIKADKSYSIEPILYNVLDIVKINDSEYISVERYQNNLRLTLRKINNAELLKELSIAGLANYSLNFLKKISNNELGMVLTPAPGNFVTLKYVIVSIPDLKLTAVEDFVYTYRPGQYQYYKFIPMNAHRILIREISPEKTAIYFFDVFSKVKTSLERFSSAVVLDKNHIAAFDQRTNNFEIQFFPQFATLSEILDEIQKKSAPQLQRPKQPQPALKRPVPPATETPIPAAAKGLKPEAREIKRQRSEAIEEPVASQSRKRAASPTREIPVAAQGVRPELPETKEPRVEKPNG